MKDYKFSWDQNIDNCLCTVNPPGSTLRKEQKCSFCAIYSQNFLRVHNKNSQQKLQKTMKKLVIIASVLMLAFTACTRTPAGDATNVTDSTAVKCDTAKCDTAKCDTLKK